MSLTLSGPLTERSFDQRAASSRATKPGGHCESPRRALCSTELSLTVGLVAGDKHGAPLRGMSVAEVAARYVTAASAQITTGDPWADDDWWIWEAVTQGIDNYETEDEGPLDPALWSELIIEAARLATGLPDDERKGIYFSLGDFSIDMLAAVDPTARHRFHAMRATHPGIEGIFHEMQEEAESMGLAGSSPWDDDYPRRRPLPDPS